MRWILLGALVCLAVVGAGCGDDDEAADVPTPTISAGETPTAAIETAESNETAEIDTPDPTAIELATEQWRFETRDGDQVLVGADASLVVLSSAPVYPQVEDNRSEERWVIGLDPGDGTERWRVTLECTPYQPVVAETAVYFVCDDGTVRALNREDGSEIWNVTPGTAPYVPVVAGDLLLLGDADPEMYGLAGTDQPRPPGVWAGKLVALDSATGDEVWRLDEDARQMFITASEGMAYVHAEDMNGGGEVIALGAATGKEVWRTDVGFPSTLPFVSKDSLYTATGGSLVALDRDNGTELWRNEDTSGERPVAGGGFVVVGDGLEIDGLSAVDGSIAWEFDYCDCSYAAQPFGETVLVSGAGVFYLDPATGDILGGAEVDDPLPPAIAGERIYVGTHGDGVLFAFE